MKTDINGYLVFMQDKQRACIKLSNIEEIIGMCEYTRIPGLPDYMLGVLNIRGQVIPIADFRKCLYLDTVIDDQTCIIIVKTKTGDLGLITNRIMDIERNLNISNIKKVESNLDFFKGLYPDDEGVIYVFDFLE